MDLDGLRECVPGLSPVEDRELVPFVPVPGFLGVADMSRDTEGDCSNDTSGFDHNLRIWSVEVGDLGLWC